MGLEPTTFCMANVSSVRTRSRPAERIGKLHDLLAHVIFTRTAAIVGEALDVACDGCRD